MGERGQMEGQRRRSDSRSEKERRKRFGWRYQSDTGFSSLPLKLCNPKAETKKITSIDIIVDLFDFLKRKLN